MIIRLSLLTLVVLLAHGSAHASCSAEEATAKAELLANKIDALTLEDPQRAAQLREELKQISPETSAQSLQDSCTAYEQRIKELEQVSDQVETAND